MRVVVAMDSFKHSMTALSASRAVRRGLISACPSLSVDLAPMADGGEGTADTILRACGGERIPCRVTGPLPELQVDAGFAWIPVPPSVASSGPPSAPSIRAGPLAVVEMAAASGLERLRADQLDPLRTTTVGTGQLLRAATDRGAARVWLAVGGSATVDGGVGAAQALGWRFLDTRGEPIGPGGAELERIKEICPPPGWDRARSLPAVDVLCDVDNPLLGPRGAARVFGPQKGATPEQVERLEDGLANLADIVKTALGVDVRDIDGAGAAGGLGAGAVAFFGANIVSGVCAVMEAVGLEAALQGAEWVITGEGRFDAQSLSGKVVSGIASRARARDVQVAVIAGSIAVGRDEAARHGVREMEQATPAKIPVEDAMRRAQALLADAAARFARRRLCPQSA